MASPYQLTSSSVVPTDPASALQSLLDAPLEELFPTRSGLIPPIRGCEGQDGSWGRVGQTRTVVLSDGSRNLETLTFLEAPGDYRYTLSDFTGPMRLLVRTVDGRFEFEPVAEGTRVTWSWAVHPTHAVARLAFPALAASWRTMARGLWPRFRARVAT
jgi:hypothetical protein